MVLDRNGEPFGRPFGGQFRPQARPWQVCPQRDQPVTVGAEEPPAPGPIVIIDDEPLAVRAMSYFLTREGYEVVTATNGVDGLQRVVDLRPPLVFLDVTMPGIDGYGVSAHTKRARAGEHIHRHADLERPTR